jgi:hypothetical protein
VHTLKVCRFYSKNLIGGSWNIVVSNLNNHERVQWRALRVILSLMQSTHVNSVEAISGVRFSYLNQKFLVCFYARSGDALRGGLKTLAILASGKYA